MLIGTELVERSEELLGFGEQVGVVVFSDLPENVVDAESVVTHGAPQVGKVRLLARESFKDLKELLGGAVERVVKFYLMRFAAAVVAEGFFAKVSNPAVHFELHAIEVVQLRGKIEYLLHDFRVKLHGLRAGLVADRKSTRLNSSHRC